MDDVKQALSPISQSLEADGYELTIGDMTSGTLHVSIAATENACEECLMPKSMMQNMIKQLVPSNLDIQTIDLRYPTDS